MRKLLLLYEGPYIITNIKSNNVYELSNTEDNTIKGSFNASPFKPYIERKIKVFKYKIV